MTNRRVEPFVKEVNRSVLTPTKKPVGGEPTEEKKIFNSMLSAVRVILEYPFRVVER